MRLRRFTFGLVAFALLNWPAPAAAQIGLEAVASGLSSPVFVTHAADGRNRLFIVEQPGIIKVLQPGGTSPTVFLDIRTQVAFSGERGLRGSSAPDSIHAPCPATSFHSSTTRM